MAASSRSTGPMNKPPPLTGRLPVYRPAAQTTSRYRVLYGGRGSGKSVFVAQNMIGRAIKGRRVLVVRKVLRTCRHSTFQLFRDILHAMRATDHVEINRTEMRIAFPGGGEILHAGLDDPDKLKSFAGITDVWIEEAFEVTEEDFIDVDVLIRGVEDPQVTLTFNPLRGKSWHKRRFIDERLGDPYVQQTTWRDNPYVSDDYGRLLASIPDENLRRIYEAGQWGEDVRGLIYPAWEAVDTMPPPEVYGLDFGFNNPTALVALSYQDGDPGALYVDEVIYESGLTDADLAGRMEAEGVSTAARIYADAAQPGSIAALVRAGFNVHPAAKGPGSVDAGIRFVQAAQIKATRRSVNIHNELASYKWDERRSTGETLDRPLKWMDHALDAMRYAAWTHYATEDLTVVY